MTWDAVAIACSLMYSLNCCFPAGPTGAYNVIFHDKHILLVKYRHATEHLGLSDLRLLDETASFAISTQESRNKQLPESVLASIRQRVENPADPDTKRCALVPLAYITCPKVTDLCCLTSRIKEGEVVLARLAYEICKPHESGKSYSRYRRDRRRRL
jgi:hypothetical protein